MAESPDQRSHPLPDINVLTAAAADLQALLHEGKVKSTDLVDLYLRKSTTPRETLLAIAEALDEERAAGKVRGPLHGIPVMVKDSICTDRSFGIGTTCGAHGLVWAWPKGNAPVVDLLVKAGMIIIGKANLSEMTGWKGFGITTGWSALGGQTQSPYIVGGVAKGEKLLGQTTPAGSSSGSAAGIAAGFAPLALATETDGSIMQTANRAALYGLKLTVGSISTEGTAPWSSLTDSVGGMAKSAEDLTHLIDAITESGSNSRNYSANLTKGWTGQTIGLVDDGLWGFVDFIYTADPAPSNTILKLRGWGATVHEKVPFPSMDELQFEGDDALEQLWNRDFAKAWEEYLKFFGTSSVRTIADIVEWNKNNAEKALPQSKTTTVGSIPDRQYVLEKYAEAINLIRTAAKTNGDDGTIAELGLDVIVGPVDGWVPIVAAAAGSPVGTVPLRYSPTNGRPYGLAVVAAAGQDQKILNFMIAWDATMPKRLPPPQLVNWKPENHL